jgi:hypothetical protein
MQNFRAQKNCKIICSIKNWHVKSIKYDIILLIVKYISGMLLMVVPIFSNWELKNSTNVSKFLVIDHDILYKNVYLRLYILLS